MSSKKGWVGHISGGRGSESLSDFSRVIQHQEQNKDSNSGQLTQYLSS
jgi:hypothetical protein